MVDSLKYRTEQDKKFDHREPNLRIVYTYTGKTCIREIDSPLISLLKTAIIDQQKTNQH